MGIPETLRAALAAADEGYLIGLSNKGTVNRAKKDLQTKAPVLEAGDDCVNVSIGGERCTITVPLGNSKCTCPSTAMCRHRIGAMLWLMDQAGEAQPKAPDFPSLRAYPGEKLVKQLGAKRVSAIYFRFRAGELPQTEQGSVITMELPWHGVRVRLLEPVEHSTCSCHSRSFCNHRAEALLFWQLQKGIAAPEAIAMDGPDPDGVRGVCAAVREMLQSQMVTGLSRMPASVCDTVERMASLSHTAGHAELERALRRLHGEYSAYFSHSAAFQGEALLSALSRAYRLAQATEAASDGALPDYLGTFREEYGRTRAKELYHLGWREHRGRGGYAGTIYYFFEPKTGEFYSYSDVRPTFYEKSARRGSAAPWDLPCTLKEACGCLMTLDHPKVSAAGNLSATRECRATLIGPRKPWEVIGAVQTDFEALLPGSGPNQPENRTLAILRPARWERQPYDHIRQVFSMELYDARGRDLALEVPYSQEEAALIAHLEGLKAARPVFFVRLYREGERLKCYPIELFDQWRDDDGFLA